MEVSIVMSAMQPWSLLMGIPPKKLTKEESFLFEAEMFFLVISAIKEFFREKYKLFFNLMNYTIEMENAMLEADYLRLIIQDIISTEEYNIKGIAFYTNTPEEILHEIISGLNKNPSAILMQRLIELHRLVRRDLYQDILKKIASEHLKVTDSRALPLPAV